MKCHGLLINCHNVLIRYIIFSNIEILINYITFPVIVTIKCKETRNQNGTFSKILLQLLIEIQHVCHNGIFHLSNSLEVHIYLQIYFSGVFQFY